MVFEDDSDSEEEVEIEVPKEIEVEEIHQKEVVNYVTVDNKVPQVMMLCKFESPSSGFAVDVNEELIVLRGTNSQRFWCVRKADGQEGFVPANYLYMKEIEPKVERVTKQKTVLVPETVKVKKTVMVKTKAKLKKSRTL